MFKFKSIISILTATALTLSLSMGVFASENSNNDSESSISASSSYSASSSSSSKSSSSATSEDETSGSESSNIASDTSSSDDTLEMPNEDGTGEYVSNGITDVFAYGSSQTDSEYNYVKQQLNVNSSSDTFKEVPIDLSIMESYVGDMPGIIGVWSSAYVVKGNKNSGVVVDITTPSNITRVTSSQYTNAVISAGANDVHVGVASAAQSYGEGALAGIYVALKEMGYDLNANVTKTAQQELNTLSEISENNANNENFDDNDFNKAIAEMKLDVAKLKEEQVTEDRVREIVNEELDKRNVEIENSDKEKVETMLTSLQSAGALESKTVKKSLKSYINDNKGFFERLINSVQDFFTNIFSGSSSSESDSTSSDESSSSEESTSDEESSSVSSSDDSSLTSDIDSDSNSKSSNKTNSENTKSESENSKKSQSSDNAKQTESVSSKVVEDEVG